MRMKGKLCCSKNLRSFFYTLDGNVCTTNHLPSLPRLSLFLITYMRIKISPPIPTLNNYVPKPKKKKNSLPSKISPYPRISTSLFCVGCCCEMLTDKYINRLLCIYYIGYNYFIRSLFFKNE